MSALESKGAQECWQIFGDSLLEPQEKPFSVSGKRIRYNKKASWNNKQQDNEAAPQKHVRNGKGDRLPKRT